MSNLIDASGGLILLSLLIIGWHCFAYSHSPKLCYWGYLFLLFFMARGMIAILNTIFEILPIQMDAIHYHTTAIQIADLLSKGNFNEIAQGITTVEFLEPGYTVLLGIFYFIFGKAPLVGFALNTFFFSLTAYNVYRIGSVCFDDISGKVASLVYLLLPYSTLHSTYLYRDPIVNYFLSEFFYRLLLITKGEKPNITQWLWISFVFFYSGILRRENLVMLSVIIGFLATRRLFMVKSILTPAITIVFFGIIAGIAAFVLYRGESWLFKNFTSLVAREAIESRIEGLQNAKSSYLTNLQYNSYFDIIKYAPIKAIYFMLSPFPWDFIKKSQLIGFAEALFIGIQIPFLLKALWIIRKKNYRFFYATAIYLFFGIVGSGLIQSNSAGAQRHRTQFTFLIVAIGMPYIYGTFLSRITLRLHAPAIEKNMTC